MAAWLVPSLFYVGAVGVLGVTGKLATRNLEWPDMVLWIGAGYMLVAAVLVISGKAALRIEPGWEWAAASAAAGIGGLIALYLALGSGDAGKVVPITAAYPAVTLVLGAIVLSEPLSLLRVLSTALIIVGVIGVTLAR